MDTKMKSEKNETSNLELILEEFTREQKLQTKSVYDLITAINSLSMKFNGFEEELKKPNPVSVSTNTQPVQDIITKGIGDLKLIVSGQPKQVVKKFQFLLFPEKDAKVFYKIVFGRWFLWLTLMLLVINVFKFGNHWSDNQKEIKLHLLEHDRIILSWNYLYSHANKGVKRMMDSAYIQINP